MKKHNYFVKLAALALALVLTLSLTACGGSNTDNSGDNAGDEQKPLSWKQGYRKKLLLQEIIR